MNRLAIFVFYDSKGKVDNYIYYLLNEVKNVAGKLVVIINGDVVVEDKKNLEKYASSIIERENRGLDGGAFKEYFTKYIRKDDLLKFDEIILFNDTFYGPIVSLESVFKETNDMKCDYWGLTRHNGYHEQGYNIPSHIQTYFLVLRKSIIRDDYFQEFWQRMETPNNYGEAIYNYEIGINVWLKRHGYKGTSYVDYKGGTNLINNCINPFIEEPYRLIKEYECPVLKRKAISLLNEEGIKALIFIDNQTTYNSKMIWNNWERKILIGDIKVESVKRIKDFCKKYDLVYIYGKGKVGTKLRHVLEMLNVKVSGYVVSEGTAETDTIEIVSLNEVENVGIIIGVGRKICEEVYNIATKTVGANNVFVLKELR